MLRGPLTSTRNPRKTPSQGRDQSSAAWGAKEETTPSFKQAASEYYALAAPGRRNGKHQDQWLSTPKSYAYPIIGNPVDAIDAEVSSVSMRKSGWKKPETARRVRQRIAAVLYHAHGKGWRETEAPSRSVDKLL